MRMTRFSHIHVTPNGLDGGFVAEVVERPGVVGKGETIEEARDNCVAALAQVRGRCPVCRYTWPLRTNGTVQRHFLYAGSVKNTSPCAGSGQTPTADRRNHPR